MKYLLIPLTFFLIPLSALAASLDFTPMPGVHAGDQFSVTITLNTDTASINAVEGSVLLPDAVTLDSVRLSGSLVPLWIEAPHEVASGKIAFAGVLPGGFQGTGNLFTLIVTAHRRVDTELQFGRETSAYQNDGAGSAIHLQKNARTLSIGLASGTPHVVATTDTVPPEPFAATIEDGAAFNLPGKVLIFATQDKDSGIDHYDVAASYSGRASEKSLEWRAAQSPYALTMDDATRYLYVRAVDHAGNSRVVSVPPQSFSPIAFLYDWWWAIAVVVLAVVLWFRVRRG